MSESYPWYQALASFSVAARLANLWRMFITFEGPEGAGKSTAIAAVAEVLRSRGLEVVSTREPGTGELGMQLRAVLLESGHVHEVSELFLFLADRAGQLYVSGEWLRRRY